MNSPAQYIDHTLLKPDATESQVAQLCEDAVEYAFASVCVLPCHVALAARTLYGSEVASGTVVGFPLGAETTEAKVFQTSQAIALGATEIDMVVNLGWAREQRFGSVLAEIRQVVSAAEGGIVKVIIECCLFDEATKQQLVEAVVDSGASFVKTSTGFAASGATPADVALLKKVAAGAVKVKASGGIRDWAACQQMLSAGASRIGTSAGVAIMQQWQDNMGLL